MEPDVAGGGGGDPGHCGLGGRGREIEDWRLASGPPGPLRPPPCWSGYDGMQPESQRRIVSHSVREGSASWAASGRLFTFSFLVFKDGLWCKTPAPSGTVLCPCAAVCARACVCVRALTWCEQFWPNWHFSRAAKEFLKMQNHNPQKPITQVPHTIPFSFPRSPSFLKK